MAATPSGRIHVRRSASQWDELFERFAASGLTQRSFCEREGLAYSSFTSHRARRKRETPRAQSVTVAPPPFVSLAPVSRSESSGAGRPSRVTLEVGDAISVHIEFS